MSPDAATKELADGKAARDEKTARHGTKDRRPGERHDLRLRVTIQNVRAKRRAKRAGQAPMPHP